LSSIITKEENKKMKSSAIDSRMVTVLMLLVAGTTMFISGGYQLLWDDFDSIGAAGFLVLFTPIAAGFGISVRKQGCSILQKWWHKRLIVGGMNKMPRIFHLLLSRSSCKSCPFISLCMGK
jgi:hypothetical protein